VEDFHCIKNGKGICVLKSDVIQKSEEKTSDIVPVTGKIACSPKLVDPPFRKGCASGESCKVSETIYPLLVKAKGIAEKSSRKFQLMSGHRTEAQQSSIWQRNPNPVMVCGPESSGSFAHCPHVSGCAVDIGFLFDENDVYKGYPSSDSTEMSDASERKKLEEIMVGAGFRRYCPESWHFEYNTKGYLAAVAGNSNCYE
jgi:D-alanyl-D-alanine dipeptidase